MQYGPFYPSQLQSLSYSPGSVAWSISGDQGSVSLSGEGTTEYLEAAGFSVEGVPDVPLSARVELEPFEGGFNVSDAQMNIGGNYDDAGGWATGARKEGLTLVQVSDEGFAAKIALYNGGSGSLTTRPALYLED